MTPGECGSSWAASGEAGGPPPGVPATGRQLLFDESQGTAVVVRVFDTAEGMRKGDEAFRAMDASDTPGTRVSVDRCELKLDRGVPADHSASLRRAPGRGARDVTLARPST